MLEKPDLQDELLVTCLHNNFGLLAAEITFLPLGADQDTAVYRAIDQHKNTYFVKLRRVPFDKVSVTLPKFLSDQGIAQIIPPLPDKTGQLWADLHPFKLIVYPFIAGHDGYELKLSAAQWGEFGRALRRIHDAAVPLSLTQNIRQEVYSPRWRNSVKSFLVRIAGETYSDPIAAEVAAFLNAKREAVVDLVRRAERLAQTLLTHSPEFIVCHSDIHAGNLHIGADGALYIVDWDAPILAPKERDLMAIGGGLMGNWRSPQEEETLFYQTYGQTKIDPAALAYYRYERIIEDIAIYCEQLLLSSDGGDDREQSLHYLKSNFLPGHTIEIAYKSDRTIRKQ